MKDVTSCDGRKLGILRINNTPPDLLKRRRWNKSVIIFFQWLGVDWNLKKFKTVKGEQSWSLSGKLREIVMFREKVKSVCFWFNGSWNFKSVLRSAFLSSSASAKSIHTYYYYTFAPSGWISRIVGFMWVYGHFNWQIMIIRSFVRFPNYFRMDCLTQQLPLIFDNSRELGCSGVSVDCDEFLRF